MPCLLLLVAEFRYIFTKPQEGELSSLVGNRRTKNLRTKSKNGEEPLSRADMESKLALLRQQADDQLRYIKKYKSDQIAEANNYKKKDASRIIEKCEAHYDPVKKRAENLVAGVEAAAKIFEQASAARDRFLGFVAETIVEGFVESVEKTCVQSDQVKSVLHSARVGDEYKTRVSEFVEEVCISETEQLKARSSESLALLRVLSSSGHWETQATAEEEARNLASQALALVRKVQDFMEEEVAPVASAVKEIEKNVETHSLALDELSKLAGFISHCLAGYYYSKVSSSSDPDESDEDESCEIPEDNGIAEDDDASRQGESNHFCLQSVLFCLLPSPLRAGACSLVTSALAKISAAGKESNSVLRAAVFNSPNEVDADLLKRARAVPAQRNKAWCQAAFLGFGFCGVFGVHLGCCWLVLSRRLVPRLASWLASSSLLAWNYLHLGWNYCFAKQRAGLLRGSFGVESTLKDGVEIIPSEEVDQENFASSEKSESIQWLSPGLAVLATSFCPSRTYVFVGVGLVAVLVLFFFRRQAQHCGWSLRGVVVAFAQPGRAPRRRKGRR